MGFFVEYGKMGKDGPKAIMSITAEELEKYAGRDDSQRRLNRLPPTLEEMQRFLWPGTGYQMVALP